MTRVQLQKKAGTSSRHGQSSRGLLSLHAPLANDFARTIWAAPHESVGNWSTAAKITAGDRLTHWLLAHSDQVDADASRGYTFAHVRAFVAHCRHPLGQSAGDVTAYRRRLARRIRAGRGGTPPSSR